MVKYQVNLVNIHQHSDVLSVQDERVNEKIFSSCRFLVLQSYSFKLNDFFFTKRSRIFKQTNKQKIHEIENLNEINFKSIKVFETGKIHSTPSHVYRQTNCLLEETRISDMTSYTCILNGSSAIQVFGVVVHARVSFLIIQMPLFLSYS